MDRDITAVEKHQNETSMKQHTFNNCDHLRGEIPLFSVNIKASLLVGFSKPQSITVIKY